MIKMDSGKKILIVVMDGLGDRAVKELDYKTPLQYANTPNLDWFAKNGSTGIMDTIGPGIRPGSDTSHLAILGYDPFEVYTGRGPFEAAGVGLVGQSGDVAFRCNFATVDSSMNVTDRRAGRIKEPDTTELVKALKGLKIGDVECIVKEATEHRAVLLLRGEGLSPYVTDADPHGLAKVGISRAVEESAEKTARVVNEFVKKSYEILNNHPVNIKRKMEGKLPANILLPRGAGMFPDIEPFEKKYGMTGSCVAGVSLIRGIGRICGLEIIDPPLCTGGLSTNMEAKAKAALAELEKKDFVLMNVKASDVSSHDGDAMKKVEVVERLDKMAGYLKENLPDGAIIVFTADHCTPVERLDHSGDPVPLCIYSENSLKDDATEFNEVSCTRGCLGRVLGKNLMSILIDKADRSEKFGA